MVPIKQNFPDTKQILLKPVKFRSTGKPRAAFPGKFIIAPRASLGQSTFVSSLISARYHLSTSSLLATSNKMANELDIKRVLLCDNVDPCCKETLEANGITVDVKNKLTKEELLVEIQVQF